MKAKIKKIAIEAAMKAGNLLIQRLSKIRSLSFKGQHSPLSPTAWPLVDSPSSMCPVPMP